MADIYVAGIIGDQITKEVAALLDLKPSILVCAEPLYQVLLSESLIDKRTGWISLSPLSNCLDDLAFCLKKSSDGVTLVLTSGDPLFFGLGRTLLKRFSGKKIKFVPSLSSMQHCFCRFGIPWDDAVFISLHGRPLANIDKRLSEEKLFVFTDSDNSPDAIARYLINRLGPDADSRMLYIAERLAMPGERLCSGKPSDLLDKTFQEPNCLIICKQPDHRGEAPPRFGLTEDDLQHVRGLITKNEVRAAALHALALPDHGILWDVGAGSGSVSVEASRLFPQLDIYAVERDRERIKDITDNCHRYKCFNVITVQGEAPEATAALPNPDRVFIGGSGGRIKELLDQVNRVIRPNGRIVLTAVTEKTSSEAPVLLKDLGFSVILSRVAVSRGTFPEGQEKEFNPITIISATRKR